MHQPAPIRAYTTDSYIPIQRPLSRLFQSDHIQHLSLAVDAVPNCAAAAGGSTSACVRPRSRAPTTISDDVLDEFLGITVMRPTLVHRRSSSASASSYSLAPSLSSSSKANSLASPTSPTRTHNHYHYTPNHPYRLNIRTGSTIAISSAAAQQGAERDGVLSPVGRPLRRASTKSKQRRKTTEERTVTLPESFGVSPNLPSPDHYYSPTSDLSASLSPNYDPLLASPISRSNTRNPFMRSHSYSTSASTSLPTSSRTSPFSGKSSPLLPVSDPHRQRSPPTLRAMGNDAISRSVDTRLQVDDPYDGSGLDFKLDKLSLTV